MSAMRDPRLIRRINLNLLYSLYAILNSDSLSQAAEMVSLTQPAISQALKKLRLEFEDELFYQEGGERRLTPLAKALKPRVEKTLLEAKETFALRLDFDPASSLRTFSIAAPESILTMFLGPQVAHFRKVAPGITLSFMKLDNLQQSHPIDPTIDLRVGPSPSTNGGADQTLLYRDCMVCLAWVDNARFDDIITVEEFATADIVGGDGGLMPMSLLGAPLSNAISQRGFAVTTDSLASLPAVLVGTELIALVPSWLAQYYAAFHPLKLISLPGPLARRIPIIAQWHPRHTDDPALKWLISELVETARKIGANADYPDHGELDEI